MSGSTVAERAQSGEAPITAVTLLNQSFDISPGEAVELWTYGVRMPSRQHGRMNTDRIRRSKDGQWVVRRDRHKGVLPSHDHAAEWAREQFERLQELGLNVISRGMVSSPDGETILTVTPWLAGITECAGTTFNAKIAPIVNRYFAGAAAGSLILSDLREPHQYSELTDTGEALLHDPDPYMSRAHSQSTRPVAQG